jgi:hypothetical protein
MDYESFIYEIVESIKFNKILLDLVDKDMIGNKGFLSRKNLNTQFMNPIYFQNYPQVGFSNNISTHSFNSLNTPNALSPLSNAVYLPTNNTFMKDTLSLLEI